MKNIRRALELLYPEHSEDRDRIRVIIKRTRRQEDDLRDLNILLKKIIKGARRGSGSSRNYCSKSGNRPARTEENRLQEQMCAVKMYYGTSKKSHLNFLRVYMPQNNKDEVLVKPAVFGNTDIEEYEKNATKKHFKWILSPEERMSAEELEEFVRSYMEKMERKTCIKISWMAVIHTDTEHPHAHILVNGADRDGMEIRRFDPDYVRNFARQDARMILTSMLGHRPERLIKAQRERAHLAGRWTRLDETIDSMLAVSLAYRNDYSVRGDGLPPDISLRLIHLAELGLAEYKDGKYYLSQDWKESLKALGRYNMYLDSKKFIEKSTRLSVYSGSCGKITGRLRHIYCMDDEGVWTNAAVIENERSGTAWFVPVFRPEIFEGLSVGDEITVESKAGKSGKLYPFIEKAGGADRDNRY